MLADEQITTPEYLISNVPRMQMNQARRTLANSLKFQRKQASANVTDEDIKEAIKSKLDTLTGRTEAVNNDMKYVTAKIAHFDRLQAPGDPEYDFHFGYEGQTEDEACEDSVSNVVNGLSTEIGTLFIDNMKKIETWQDSFEQQQDDL